MARIFAAGGIVMWPLLVFSLVAIALIIERLIFWFRLNRRQRKVMQMYCGLIGKHPLMGTPSYGKTLTCPALAFLWKRWTLRGRVQSGTQESVSVINADEAVEHGRVIAVMDELREIEGAALGIATERE